jgi:predicted O-methyltransferase YrrM
MVGANDANAASPKAETRAVSDKPIPYPKVDFDRVPNPIPAIMSAAEFDEAATFFDESPMSRRALVTGRGHAMIHTLIRNQRPAHVVEIGSYCGGTTEVMARAVVANGGGTVHTVGPFDAERFMPVYEQWTADIRQAVRFYAVDSMAFYMDMERQGIRPDLVFIDGHHDYEFALFDILCAARRLRPGGFMVVDDSSQAGPYFAAQDFLARHSDWIECAGPSPLPHDCTKAFDWERTHVRGADCVILRAPMHYGLFDDRPMTFGEVAWSKPKARGLALSLDGRQGAGTLHVQCILRGFGNGQPPAQVVTAGSKAVAAGARRLTVRLSEPATIAPARDRYTLEPWVIWIGPGPLRLGAIPQAF